MVRTPWGTGDELRDRRLPPGPGASREEVARNQRERLYGATVAVVATKGYAATTVADLLEASGVSRRAFYEHFAGKEACFVATVREILTVAAATTASRLRKTEGPWEERAQRSVGAFLELLVAQPAAARLCLVEARAAGGEAEELVGDALEGFRALLEQAYAQMLPGQPPVPEEMSRALICGFAKLIHTRLHRGEEAELLELAPDLVALGLAYRPPPAPLRSPSARRAARADGDGNGDGDGESGAAAGSAALARARRGRDGEAVERILRATADSVAAKGFAATRVGDVVEAAGASLSTFYQHFAGKEEAFDAALYAGRSRMLGYGLPVWRRAKSWPDGIRALTEFCCSYLAGEPEFARLIAVDVYAAGPEALERRDRGIAAAQRFLEEGVEAHAPAMPPIWREAIISALYAMLCERVAREGAETLPEMAPLATYLALLPFIGAEAACEIANGGRWPAQARKGG